MRYIWNLSKGIGIEMVNEEVEEHFYLFIYEKDEDITQIEGRQPLVFTTRQDKQEAINRIMVGDWDDNTTIVIRKMNIIIV